MNASRDAEKSTAPPIVGRHTGVVATASSAWGLCLTRALKITRSSPFGYVSTATGVFRCHFSQAFFSQSSVSERLCVSSPRNARSTRPNKTVAVCYIPYNSLTCSPHSHELSKHPYVQVHAMQTNEIFLLVGEVLAQVAAAFFSQLDPHTRAKDTDGKSGDTEGSSLVAARAPFADFVQEPWWDVAVPRDAGAEDAAHAADIAADTSLPHTLRALCEESSALLRGALTLALGPLPTLLEAALSVEGFARVVGMFEQNNVGVRAPSPVPGGLRELLLADGGPGREDEGGASVHSHRGAKGLGVLREAAELVSQIIEQEEDSEDDDEDKEQVVLNRCGGQEEGGEGHGDARGCCSSTAVCASKDGEISAEGAGKTDLSAAAAAAGGEVESAEGDEDILAILRSALDGGEGDAGEDIFAPLDGTALYSLVCCMNHSCRPNCVVRYPGRRYRELGGRDGGAATADPLVAEVVLLEDVPAGEELTQSYVSREMGLTERRRALEDYGFSCACPRCLEEEAASLS